MFSFTRKFQVGGYLLVNILPYVYMRATLEHSTSPPEPPKTSCARKSDFMGAHFIIIDRWKRG